VCLEIAKVAFFLGYGGSGDGDEPLPMGFRGLLQVKKVGKRVYRFGQEGEKGAGFSGVITPLFDTMMVRAPADMGDTPVETHQTPIVDQPSTSKPQKKQKPRRKQRKEADVSNDESKDSFILNELMVFCTSLQEQIALDDETQGRTNDDEMFGINDLAGEEVVVDTTTSKHEEQIIEDVSTVEPVTTADEVVTTTMKDSDAPTIDQAMSTTIPTTVTTVTTTVPTPRARGIGFHEQKQSQIPTVSSLKDKGKAKMIKPEVPIKKKDQMRIDEECARRLEDYWLKGFKQEKGKNYLREMRKVNDFIAMDLETKESSTKRTAKHLESDISKKQKVDENVKPVIDDTEEIKKCMEIVLDDGDELFWIYPKQLSFNKPRKIYKEWDQQVMIEEIDQNAEIALDDETQGRTNDDKMFGVDDLAGEEVVVDTITAKHEEQIIKDVSTAEPVITAGEVVTTTTFIDSAAPTTDVTEDEITMAQALIVLKSIKPKVVQSQIPIKKKDQMRIDEEYARRLEAKEQEATRLSRAQQDEKANNSWDNKQAMMDADRLLAVRLQTREMEEFSKVQKARLLVELIVKRKKHFAALRAQEKRNKPHTKTQIKSQMSTYLKHMGGYK
nr:hypothetical protein [Tanacetum cinerariifolium]